ncbi:MAG TPA: ABC transporter substrate-binding protein [Gemmataceae bacterium]|nr:ABC transporter substrate-binding protein [Gemmataceae bacterium]
MRFLGRVFLPCCFLLALCGCKSKAEPSPLLIGHVAPFSGPDKSMGEHARQAIRLAITEANSEENGAAGLRVAVVHVDAHGSLEALQPEVVRLIKVNGVVGLFGGKSAAEVERLGHAAQPYDVPLITPAAVPTELMTDNVYSVSASLAFQGQILARFLTENLKATPVAILVDSRRPASIALAEAFEKEPALMKSAAPRQWSYQSDADLAKAIEQLKAMKPQAVLYAGAAADLARTRTLLQAMGITAPLLLGAESEQLAALQSNPNPGHVVYLATPYGSGNEAPKLLKFDQDYQKRFHEPPDTDARLAYEGIQILIQAIRRAKPPSSASAVAKQLGDSEGFDSLTGHVLFGKYHALRRPLFVIRMENGQRQEAKRFDPDGP